MAGSSLKKEEARHVKPEPGADTDDVGIASIPAPSPSDVADNFKAEADAAQAALAQEPNYIEQLVSRTSIEELEVGVNIGIQLLESLKIPLQAALGNGDTQASQWLKSIELLQDEAGPARTVVGVVFVPYLPVPLEREDAMMLTSIRKGQHRCRQELCD